MSAVSTWLWSGRMRIVELSNTTSADEAQIFGAVDATGRRLSRGAVLNGLRESAAARTELSRALLATTHAAFFWETPALTLDSLEREYEHAVIPAPRLAKSRANPSAFEAYLGGGGQVAVFENLGGDATLVVPTDQGAPAAYGHLGAFLRGGPGPQIDAFWEAVAAAVLGRVTTRPLWLSTAGMGVPWLHIRLDSRPKYYRHGPYRALES
jgi:hypothetical protein